MSRKNKRYSKELKLEAVQSYLNGEGSYEELRKRYGLLIEKLCQKLNVSRAAYYKWQKRKPSNQQLENEKISGWIRTLYEEQDGILGYRQMTITVNREYNVHYNRKRIRRLMQILHLKSVCRKKRYNYIIGMLYKADAECMDLR